MVEHADVVEVVRCKDCAFWYSKNGYCGFWEKIYTNEDGYCYKGERMNGRAKKPVEHRITGGGYCTGCGERQDRYFAKFCFNCGAELDWGEYLDVQREIRAKFAKDNNIG